MSGVPKLYRVYCFDIDRKVVSVEFIKAMTDPEAIAKTKEAGFGSKCEIWDSRRLVAQLEQDRGSISPVANPSLSPPAL